MQRLACFTITALLLAASAHAQTITATITGTIRDPQGSALPAASITVISEEKAQKRTVTSNAEGHYSVSFLQPGNYTILATAKAFGKVSRAGIKLALIARLQV